MSTTTDLLVRVRMSAFIPDAAQAPDYTDAWILNELNDMQPQLYERTIVNSKQGYWRKSFNVTTVAGSAFITVPPRACAGGLAKVDIALDSTLSWIPMREVNEDDIRLYESNVTGQPMVFIMRGDAVQLVPTPSANTWTIRVTYYSRPSTLVAPQVSLSSGLISNIVGTTLTVGALPQNANGGSNIANGNLADIVRPTGWHELQVIGALVTNVTGSTSITLAAGTDMSTVAVGDYVRFAEQSEWPNLPDDYVRSLCDSVAAKILVQLNLTDKSTALQAELAADLTRFQDLLSPRVKNTGGTDVVAPFNMYRGNSRTRVVKYP